MLKADEKVEAKLIMLKVGVANGCQDCIPLPGSWIKNLYDKTVWFSFKGVKRIKSANWRGSFMDSSRH